MWRRFVCRVVGHTAPDRIGECVRCGADLLGMPPSEKLEIVLREYIAALRLVVKWGGRS